MVAILQRFLLVALLQIDTIELQSGKHFEGADLELAILANFLNIVQLAQFVGIIEAILAPHFFALPAVLR